MKEQITPASAANGLLAIAAILPEKGINRTILCNAAGLIRQMDAERKSLKLLAENQLEQCRGVCANEEYGPCPFYCVPGMDGNPERKDARGAAEGECRLKRLLKRG